MKYYFSLFLLVSITFATTAQLPQPLTNYKYQVAYEVFQRLVEAKGDRQLPPPRFEMRPVIVHAAYRNGNTIGLEELTYDICTTFGKDSLNALAAILAHELIHYYYHVEVDQPQYFTGKDEEEEADYAGKFLAYAAGFSTFGLTAQLLEKIYEVYGLPDALQGYPTKRERIVNTQKADAYSQQLVNAFKMGNYLSLLDEYELAIAYYHYILKTYQSRELYNNMAISYLLLASSNLGSEEIPHLYPFMLDPYTRLNRRRQFNDMDTLYKIALEHIELATQMDSTYSAAYLTKACTYSLLKQYDLATSIAQIALEKSQLEGDTVTQHGVYLLLGTIAAQQKDNTSALKWWNRSSQYPFYRLLAQANLTLFNRQKLKKPLLSNLELVHLYQNNQPIDFEQYDNTTQLPYVDTLQINNKITTGQKHLGTTTILTQQYKNTYFMLGYTQANYTHQALPNIHLGTTATALQQQYGQPDKIWPARQGAYWIYYSAQIIFLLDKHQQIEEWCVYGPLPDFD